MSEISGIVERLFASQNVLCSAESVNNQNKIFFIFKKCEHKIYLRKPV
jgi:hypothetical protein